MEVIFLGEKGALVRNEVRNCQVLRGELSTSEMI